MWNETQTCSVDTLLDKKECTTNLREWTEYNLDDFPGLKETLQDVILDLRNRTKNVPNMDLVEYIRKNADKLSTEMITKLSTQESNKHLLSMYEKFIKNNNFYVRGMQIYVDVQNDSMVKYYGVTISPEKNWEEALRVNLDLLTNKKFKLRK